MFSSCVLFVIFEKIFQPSVVDNSIQPMTFEMPYKPDFAGNGLQVETMEGTVPPPGWSIINNDSNFTFWQYIYNPIGGPSFPGVRAIRINYFSYAENIGTKDYLKTKVYNNVNPADSIKFDWAYAQRPGFEDRLAVKVSIDGGNTFPYTIFDKQGAVLGTAPAQSTGFVPTSTQWGTFAGRFGALVGVEPVGSFTPTRYELMQNYPNPYNPSTTIKYQVAENSFVTLKVYDLLGKEIATLVNSNLKPGLYELQFNASGLTSGIYFYKISAGNYTDTKKMILIK